MVAQLLGLKLQVLANGFRRADGAIIRIIAGVALVALAVLASSTLIALRERAQWMFEAAVVPFGALLLLTCALLPVATARDEPLHARAFVGYEITPTRLALALPLTDLLSLPTLLIGIYLVGFVVAWAALPGAVGIALLCAAVLLVIGLQLVRLGSTLGAWLARHPRGRLLRAIVAIVLLVALAAVLAPAAIDTRYAFASLEPEAAWLGPGPLGALWIAPADGSQGIVAVLVALGVIAALWLVWRIVVGIEFTGRRPEGAQKGVAALGWFGILPVSPIGAISARSLTYWVRDPRYLGSVILLPIVPVLMIVAATVGGLPSESFAFAPLSVFVLVLAWSTTHNDVALDSTAMWAHVVANTRGRDDRIGRLVPPLVLGLIAVAIGVPLTVWWQGDPASAPAVLGLSLGILFGAIGVSSGVSARLPYAAPLPGSTAFEAPQSAGNSGAAAQVLSFAGSVVAAAPAIASVVLWLLVGAPWNWIALGAGVGVGLLVLIAGIAVGGRTFEHRSPEILAFTMRN